MVKVDCIVEMREEAFRNGLLKASKNLLLEGASVETVSRLMELPISEITNLKMSLNRDA